MSQRSTYIVRAVAIVSVLIIAMTVAATVTIDPFSSDEQTTVLPTQGPTCPTCPPPPIGIPAMRDFYDAIFRMVVRVAQPPLPPSVQNHLYDICQVVHTPPCP